MAVPLPPGTRVHDHVIEQWLRAVPDGYVYRVIHAQTGAVAALHEYLPAAWAFRDAEGVMAKPGRGREFQVGLRRFLLRARQLRELEHPSLPRLIEAWPSHGTACILTSPATTRTLSDVVIAAGGRLPLDEAWPWLCACCDLAEWLHQQGKIHGSWDPETIGVTDDNRLLLPMPEVDGPAHPASPWMPLEQTALAPKGVQRGPWTDVFGISGLAAFMLTGQSPATARRQPTAPVINTTPRASRTSASAETLPRAMMAAIRVSLLPNARQRPQDIAQLKAMMGLFATAPVLSEELKAALAVPVVSPSIVRGSSVMPPLPRADAPVRTGAVDPATQTTRAPAAPPGSSFGEMPTEPMPLLPAGATSSQLIPPAGGAADRMVLPSSPEVSQAFHEQAAWDGEEPLAPDPALRRRLSAGAAAAGLALLAAAALWVVFADKPQADRSGVSAESLQPRDMDRMLKSTPPAAGPVDSRSAAPGQSKAESPIQAAPARPADAPPSPAAQVPAAGDSLQRQTGSAAPIGAEKEQPSATQEPTRPDRKAGKPAVGVEQMPASDKKPAAASRGPSCSQILLEQSLGAPVSAADLRNCR